MKQRARRSLLAFVLAASYVVTVESTPVRALSPSIGHLDVVGPFDPTTEHLLIQGWALTSDAPLSALGVRITIDGQVYPMASPGYILANAIRTDVGNQYPGYGDYHGFNSWVPAPIGGHTICAQAQNSGVYTTLLGCQYYYMPAITSGFGAPHHVADANPHTYATTETNETEKAYVLSTFNDRMVNQYSARTDLTVSAVGYTAFTDAYWEVVPSLVGATSLAETQCMNLLAGGICETSRVRFRTSWASGATAASKRHVTCHEIGHTVGFDDSVPQLSIGCMSGGMGVLSTNEIWNIDGHY